MQIDDRDASNSRATQNSANPSVQKLLTIVTESGVTKPTVEDISTDDELTAIELGCVTDPVNKELDGPMRSDSAVTVALDLGDTQSFGVDERVPSPVAISSSTAESAAAVLLDVNQPDIQASGTDLNASLSENTDETRSLATASASTGETGAPFSLNIDILQEQETNLIHAPLSGDVDSIQTSLPIGVETLPTVDPIDDQLQCLSRTQSPVPETLQSTSLGNISTTYVEVL